MTEYQPIPMEHEALRTGDICGLCSFQSSYVATCMDFVSVSLLTASMDEAKLEPAFNALRLHIPATKTTKFFKSFRSTILQVLVLLVRSFPASSINGKTGRMKSKLCCGVANTDSCVPLPLSPARVLLAHWCT